MRQVPCDGDYALSNSIGDAQIINFRQLLFSYFFAGFRLKLLTNQNISVIMLIVFNVELKIFNRTWLSTGKL